MYNNNNNNDKEPYRLEQKKNTHTLTHTCTQINIMSPCLPCQSRRWDPCFECESQLTLQSVVLYSDDLILNIEHLTLEKHVECGIYNVCVCLYIIS